ncbi:hypothetical protein AIA08_004604 [Salmonella enterica subsp. enterica serovar Wichita]|nr:hypothetical protein [Salmonella enterica subsp. salamae]EGZ3996715.1 hypothetical protein [Salmonella enterica subsp. enterica serovar Wichita]
MPCDVNSCRPLTDREELTQTLNQFSQIEASLHRVQQSAITGINERYYFDYPRIRWAGTP